MRVLLVDHNATTMQSLEGAMHGKSWVCHVVDTGANALEILKLHSGKGDDYDIIVLEIMLPDMDGLAFVRQLRKANVHTPLLVFTGLNDINNEIEALNLGANDYLTKPCNVHKVLAHIGAIARRSHGHDSSVMTVGDLTLDTSTYTVSVKGTPLHLTGKEFSILELLLHRRGMIITKEMFLNHLYGGMDEPELKIIDVFICKLRKKLTAVTDGVSYIETVWGKGYCLVDPSAEKLEQKVGAATLPSRTIPAEFTILNGSLPARNSGPPLNMTGAARAERLTLPSERQGAHGHVTEPRHDTTPSGRDTNHELEADRDEGVIMLGGKILYPASTKTKKVPETQILMCLDTHRGKVVSNALIFEHALDCPNTAESAEDLCRRIKRMQTKMKKMSPGAENLLEEASGGYVLHETIPEQGANRAA